VGGSSTINACYWLRGSAADYDGWTAAGNQGWSFAELLPYFRRAEADPLPRAARLPSWADDGWDGIDEGEQLGGIMGVGRRNSHRQRDAVAIDDQVIF
jgi:choline dehydrogenase-like flavoprotein